MERTKSSESCVISIGLSQDFNCWQRGIPNAARNGGIDGVLEAVQKHW
jgi:hypothetical protein